MIKSKKTTLKLLICVLALLALAMTLVACNIGNMAEHYDYRVTYEYNVGTGDNALECDMTAQYVGILGENSRIKLKPGDDAKKFREGFVEGYYIEGWYLPAEVNENGEPKRDENGFVVLGKKWDFKRDTVDKDLTLYCNFVKMFALRFINRGTGEYIDYTIDYRPGMTISKPISAPTLKDHTFLGSYYDADGHEYKWGATIEKDEDVYVDFIEGIWTLVSDEDGFKAAIAAKNNIYLLENLNFQGKTAWSNSSTYTGTINGNGHTISNVSHSIRLGKLDTSASFGGVFGALGATAYIHDINFENVTVELRLSTSYPVLDAYAGILVGTIENGAKLENVSISGTLKYNSIANKTVHDGGVTGDNGVKGVIGQNKGNDNIKDCNFTAEVNPPAEVTVA
ncbi:MAG: hypothetical protein K2N18_01180 [Clostridia bacterium]|nr:hypothetical protein [Clostridia bacterium]